MEWWSTIKAWPIVRGIYGWWSRRRKATEEEVEGLRQQVAELQAARDPYRDTFEMFGVLWRFAEAEGRNVPSCPVCAADRRYVPLIRTAPRGASTDWSFHCPNHGLPTPAVWDLTPEQYEAARCYEIPAAQVATGGLDRVRDEPLHELNEQEVDILLFLAKASFSSLRTGARIPLRPIARAIGENETRTQHYLEGKLTESKLVYPHYNSFSGHTYRLTAEGRKYLVENELI